MLLSGAAEFEVGTREWGEGAMDGVGLVLVAAAEAERPVASQGRGRGEGLLRMWGRGWLAGGGGVAVSACVLS